ncbi:hypothetical protein HELRODRAFT_172723 [Helobdella robusta]|uniref:Uncharacterized protein n=1 Tax=Helobdella robusta TaxID=6412 RepID=T1F5U8_HELRO|nr:hypothetical protein HELRODRAFT_172723 [Helobdella robusta]ESO04356.1 hypothetical protein HELRODRAFT_172723 [Helobdella robusta]
MDVHRTSLAISVLKLTDEVPIDLRCIKLSLNYIYTTSSNPNNSSYHFIFPSIYKVLFDKRPKLLKKSTQIRSVVLHAIPAKKKGVEFLKNLISKPKLNLELKNFSKTKDKRLCSLQLIVFLRHETKPLRNEMLLYIMLTRKTDLSRIRTSSCWVFDLGYARIGTDYSKLPNW